MNSAPPPTSGGAAFAHAQAQQVSTQGEYPLFPVAIHKLVVMSICTFGIYELYWFYKQWKRIKDASGESMRPFWRAVFAPYWAFKLFKRIEDQSASEGRSVGWNGTALALVYAILNLTWRLPDPWSLISFATVIPLIPIQRAVQEINARQSQYTRESQNHRYGLLNIATILIGGGLFVLGTVGTFLPGEEAAQLDVSQPAGPGHYTHEGIGFEHPGDWAVTGDVPDEGRRYVFVETPGNAMVTIHVYPADEALPLRGFSRNYARAAQEETPFGSNTPSRFGRVERTGTTEVVTERFSLDAFGEQDAYTRVYTRKAFGGVMCFIVAQVADDEHEEVASGFELITTSLKYDPS